MGLGDRGEAFERASLSKRLKKLAMMNAHGHLTIVRRLKEVVMRGGENIFPREVEE